MKDYQLYDHKNIVNVSSKAEILTVKQVFIFNRCESVPFIFISTYIITAELHCIDIIEKEINKERLDDEWAFD